MLLVEHGQTGRPVLQFPTGLAYCLMHFVSVIKVIPNFLDKGVLLGGAGHKLGSTPQTILDNSLNLVKKLLALVLFCPFILVAGSLKNLVLVFEFHKAIPSFFVHVDSGIIIRGSIFLVISFQTGGHCISILPADIGLIGSFGIRESSTLSRAIKFCLAN